MKQVLFCICLMAAVFTNLKCSKDLTDDPPKETAAKSEVKMFAPENFYTFRLPAGERDGVKLPFDFPVSMVEHDVWTNSQTTYNQMMIDSNTYQKLDNVTYTYQGVHWHKYMKHVIYNNGTDTLVKVFAPSGGDFYTVIPNLQYNQLAVNNPYKTWTLRRTDNKYPYWDHFCGKQKLRFEYNQYTGDIYISRDVIDGDRCISNVHSYQLIL